MGLQAVLEQTGPMAACRPRAAGRSGTAALKEPASAQDGQSMPQSYDFGDKVEKLLFRITDVPIHPAKFIVLAISVIVTLLSTTKLITTKHMRDPLRQHQSGKQITFLAFTHNQYFCI